MHYIGASPRDWVVVGVIVKEVMASVIIVMMTFMSIVMFLRAMTMVETNPG